jgi:hypothetical protein
MVCDSHEFFRRSGPSPVTNVRRQPRLEAGAQRTLEGIGCTPLFDQDIIRTAFGHPNMRSCRQFQAAADDCAVEYINNRYLTVFDLLERTVAST